MKMKRHGILYLIADRRQGDRKILEALDAGVDIVQLREKERNSAEYLEDAVWLGREAGKRGILFLVNDRLDIGGITGLICKSFSYSQFPAGIHFLSDSE